WVENARGLLVHRVTVEAGRARSYRIVAPTDWNFLPRGAVAAALLGTPVEARAEAARRSLRVVRSLDPCVACHVEFDDA
ncbi:MAG: nickel-dependent hydrogenase large subunit, partial [Caldimonas sp.]